MLPWPECLASSALFAKGLTQEALGNEQQVFLVLHSLGSEPPGPAGGTLQACGWGVSSRQWSLGGRLCTVHTSQCSPSPLCPFLSPFPTSSIRAFLCYQMGLLLLGVLGQNGGSLQVLGSSGSAPAEATWGHISVTVKPPLSKDWRGMQLRAVSGCGRWTAAACRLLSHLSHLGSRGKAWSDLGASAAVGTLLG